MSPPVRLLKTVHLLETLEYCINEYQRLDNFIFMLFCCFIIYLHFSPPILLKVEYHFSGIFSPFKSFYFKSVYLAWNAFKVENTVVDSASCVWFYYATHNFIG